MVETLWEIEARIEVTWSELRSTEQAGQPLAVCALLYDSYLGTLDEWATTHRLQQREAAAEAFQASLASQEEAH